VIIMIMSCVIVIKDFSLLHMQAYISIVGSLTAKSFYVTSSCLHMLKAGAWLVS